MYFFILAKLICILVVPAMLLTVSFFVLVTMRKADCKSLKIFGKGLAWLLWGIATLIFVTGIYAISLGTYPFKKAKTCSFYDYKMDPHHGMSIDPHHGMMSDPHHGMITDPHQGLECDPHHGGILKEDITEKTTGNK